METNKMIDKNLLENANSWPFVEARKILKKINNTMPTKGYVLFETGYGPSGLPHIGTFGEVARTSMVKFAFEQLSNIPTKLIAFSDDMDGLRKVPSNVPNQDLLAKYLGYPLTQVPDPFEKYNSFGEHNNAMLQDFLDKFGFEYEFYSSTKIYKSGVFNNALLNVLEKYDDIMNVMLPTLGEERRATYSPFLPVGENGRVLEAKVISIDAKKGTIVYINENNKEVEIDVRDGRCKLQWKVDWAMRWHALSVDYEMSGKDLIPSVQLSTKICKILGTTPPLCLSYELFLDKEGQKISKSKGNGLSIDDWLSYGTQESLSYYMYQKPQTAKRLYLESIPKNMDDWITSASKYNELPDKEKIESPLYFIYKNNVPNIDAEISFALILNLVNVIKTEDSALLLNYINKYRIITSDNKDFLHNLIKYAINYYNDFIKPNLHYKVLNDVEKDYLRKLANSLEQFQENSLAIDVQTVVYSIGKELQLDLKSWFQLLYESLLGQSEGPRIGSFFVLYGIKNSIELLNNAIKRI